LEYNLNDMMDSKQDAPKEKMVWVDHTNLFFYLRRYIKMLAKRWPLLLLTTLVGTGYMVFKAVRSPNIYQSHSRIGVAPKIIRPGTSTTVVVEEYNSFYENQIALMTGAEVRSMVDFELQQSGITNRPALIQPIAAREGGSIRMTVRSTDYVFAKAFASVWGKAFIDFKKKRNTTLIGNSINDTRSEIIKLERKLTEARESVYDFQKRYNIASIKETGELQLKRYEELDSRLKEVSTQRKKLEGKTTEDLATSGITDARTLVTQPGGAASSDPGRTTVIEQVDPLSKYLEGNQYTGYKKELIQAQTSLREFERTLKSAHPYMVGLKEKIAKLEESIRIELSVIEDKRMSRIQSLNLEENILKPLVDEARQRVLDSNSTQTEFTKLKEEEGNIKATLDRLRRSLQDMELSPSDESEFDLLEAGMGSPEAVEPNRPKMVATGLIAGMFAGILLIYFLERLDDRLELAEDIENMLEEPVLGQLPQVPEQDGREQLLVTRLDDHSMFSEALRGVRSAVLLGFQGAKQKVLLVSSAVPGDGKTTFTTNFAITLAIAGHKVLLVDADLRRGNTHNFFGNSREEGFTDILQGSKHWTEVVHDTEVPTLKVIHCGKFPSNPGELLISPIPAELIAEAKAEFDYVILDCPPLTAIDDTFSLIPLADGMLFVVRSGVTSMRFAKTAVASLRQRGTPVMGLVVNGIAADNPYYYYQSYYHGYYSKGSEQTLSSKVTSSSMPVQKMARPKSGRRSFKVMSIEEEAKAFSGADSTSGDESADGTSGQLSKIEQFKAARRGVAQDASGAPEASDLEPAVADSHIDPSAGGGHASQDKEPQVGLEEDQSKPVS